MAEKVGSLLIDLAANVARLQQDMNKARNVVSEATEKMGKAWESFRSLLAAGIAGEALREIVKSAKEGEDSINKLTAAFKRQGDGIGFSRDQLEGFADELSKATKFDDKDFRNAESELLRFGNIYGDVFEQALSLSADLAAFNDTDLKSSTTQLAAALANPAEGLKGLQSAIGKLTPAQNEMIKSFLRANDVLGAQNYILGLVRQKVGGVAAELNTGYSKRIDDAAKSWDRLKEALGQIAALKGSVIDALEAITTTLEGLAAVFQGKSFSSGFLGDRAAMAKQITDLQTQIQTAKSRQGLTFTDDEGRVIGEDLHVEDMEKKLKELQDTYDKLYQSQNKVKGPAAKIPKIGLTEDQIGYLKGLDKQLAEVQNSPTQGSFLAGAFAQAGQLNVLDQAKPKILAINQAMREQADAMKQADEDFAFRKNFQDFTDEMGNRTSDIQRQTAALGSNAEAMQLLGEDLKYEEQVYQATKGLTSEQTAEWQKQADLLKGPYMAALRENIAVARQWQTGVKQAFSDLADQAADKATLAKNAVVSAFEGMENALVSFVQTGKLNFTDLANSIIADLIRIQIRQSITGPLAATVGGLFAGGFGSGPSSAGPAGGRGFVQLATGTDYVPQDMFAMIHKGEAVVPREYNTGNRGNTYNVDARGADSAGMANLLAYIRSVDGSINQRAVSAVKIARQRGESGLR